jgi:hypothetical protein
MRIRRYHLMRPLVVAAAIFGLAAPMAQADSGASANQLTRARVPAALAGPSETSTDVREDGSYFDPSLGRRVRVTPRVTIVEPSAFDWGDAGVGAAGAVGLMLLACGVVIVSQHSHRVRRDPDAEASAGT